MVFVHVVAFRLLGCPQFARVIGLLLRCCFLVLLFVWIGNTGAINNYNRLVAYFFRPIFVLVNVNVRPLKSWCFVKPFYLVVVDNSPLDTNFFAPLVLDSVYHFSQSFYSSPRSCPWPIDFHASSPPGFSVEPQHQISFFEKISSCPTIVQMFLSFAGSV